MVGSEGMADFTTEEFAHRVERVQELMVAKGLAGLIVYDDDRMTGGGNVRYLSNFFNTGVLTPSAIVLVPGREPTLCISPGFQRCQFAWAERLTWIRNVRGTPSGMWRVDWATDIAEGLNEAGFRSGKVGIDGMGFMSHGLVEELGRRRRPSSRRRRSHRGRRGGWGWWTGCGRLKVPPKLNSFGAPPPCPGWE